MTQIVVATDGSEGADRAIDYAARLAKKDGADLLIVNVIGGYSLPDVLMSRFTHEQQTWWDELLDAISAEILIKARDRARAAGAGTVQLESRRGRRRNNDPRHRARKGCRCHHRTQTWCWRCGKAVARQQPRTNW
jgi:nucleotide-binding universal stress UspA family protein